MAKYLDWHNQPLKPGQFYSRSCHPLAPYHPSDEFYFTDEKGIPRDSSGGTANLPYGSAPFHPISNPQENARALEKASLKLQGIADFFRQNLESAERQSIPKSEERETMHDRINLAFMEMVLDMDYSPLR